MDRAIKMSTLIGVKRLGDDESSGREEDMNRDFES